jgi:hypothetical protein
MVHLKGLEERHEGKTSSSIEAYSIVGEGRQYLNKLDAAHSKATAELKRQAEEHDDAQAK